MKNKIIKILLTILAVTVTLLSISGCRAITRHGWGMAYEAFTQEGRFDYQIVNATVISTTFRDDRISYKLKIDEEDYLERYSDDKSKDYQLNSYSTEFFYIIQSNCRVLEENGFFNDVQPDTVITFTTNNYYGWDGWAYPIFEVKINEKNIFGI